MALWTINKVVIGAITTGGFAGATAYVHDELTKVTIKDKLGETLLSYQAKDDGKWKARGVSLSNADATKLSPDLNKIKETEDADGSKIKGWCQTNIKNKFTSDKDTLFLEVQKYCTYNIKDKIGKIIIKTAWQNNKHNKNLKDSGDEVWLSDNMKSIKAKLNKEQPEEDALKDWCDSSYEKPFKGEQDQDYLDALSYCVDRES